MGTLTENNNFIDVICQYTTDGRVIPLKIRVKDEDGVYQTFMIKAYKELSHPGAYKSPYGTLSHSRNWSFECKIQVFNIIKQITLCFNSEDNLWKITSIH